MSDQKTQKEKTYMDSILDNVAFNNVCSMVYEILRNGAETKNKFLVGYTEGLTKPTGNELSIDHGSKLNIKLEDRCQLIKEMNEMMSAVVQLESGHVVPGLRYEAIVDKAARNCRVYRHTDYTLPGPHNLGNGITILNQDEKSQSIPNPLLV